MVGEYTHHFVIHLNDLFVVLITYHKEIYF